MSNTDDRKMLEDAARAMGLQIVGPVENFIVQIDDRLKGGFIIVNDRGGHSAWNSLRDGGDCHDMETQLKLWTAYNNGCWTAYNGEAVRSDPDRKRASTMCAAAIWREK